MKFLIQNQYATDNTNIAVFSLLGYLFSFTETTFINYHDPVTLETLGTFNLRKLDLRASSVLTRPSKSSIKCLLWNVNRLYLSSTLGEADNFPEDAFCQTQTAHGHFDEDGTFWNIMACMESPAPTVAYYPYKIPNARRTGPDQFENRPSKEEFLASIIFGEPFHNTDIEDYSIHYHHMTS